MEHNLGGSEFGYCIPFNYSLYQYPSLFFMHNSVKDDTVYVVPNYILSGGLLKYQSLTQTEADVMNEPIGFCAKMCTFTFKIKWGNFHLLLLLSVLLVNHLVWKLGNFGTHKVWNALLPH